MTLPVEISHLAQISGIELRLFSNTITISLQLKKNEVNRTIFDENMELLRVQGAETQKRRKWPP